MSINAISNQQPSYLNAHLEELRQQYGQNNTATQNVFNNNNQVKADSFNTTNNNQSELPADGADDGKISFGSMLKNFGKGLISPITSMFSSAKNFIIGAGMIAGGAFLTVATGGAILPFFVAAGATLGTLQFGASAYKAATAKTDAEAENAWQGMGAGTSTVALSVAGAKGSLKANGVDTSKMNCLEATVKCFEQTPNSVSKSFGAFTSGEAAAKLGIKDSVKTEPETKAPETTTTENKTTTTEKKSQPTEETTKETATEIQTETESAVKPVETTVEQPKPVESQTEQPKPVETVEEQPQVTQNTETQKTAEQPTAQPTENTVATEEQPKAVETVEEQSKLVETQKAEQPKPVETVEEQPQVAQNAETQKITETTSTNSQAVTKAESKVNTETKPNIFDYGTREVSEPLKVVTKDGQTVEYTITRRYVVEDGPCGKRAQVRYQVKDTNGTRVGDFDGMINMDEGIFNGHGIQSFKKGIGLGKTMKKYIANDARQYNCSRINIDACFESHMFHNKMGYKCDFARYENNADYAFKVLNSIKKTGAMPEFEARIDNALKTKDIKEIDTLLDDIFTAANKKHLNSMNIGVSGIQIPMTYKL